jgi:NitT/TauT family transport system ATP-binding protein
MSERTSADTERPSAGCLHFEGVRHEFGGAKGASTLALAGVDLRIEQGQFVALVGASGCGKTTLLNMLAGVLAPTHGTVTIGGEPPALGSPHVGYMFARDALLPWRRAQSNVELPLENRGWDRARRRERAQEMLALVGLKGRERQFRSQLSQGMRQRVALARTLAPSPDVLLMDEPFAALDARTKLAMQTEFLSIWERANAEGQHKTVIFVTHDLNEAVLLADRVVVMLPHPGRIARDRVIDLPRPRAADLHHIIYSDEFRRIAGELFEELEGAIA